MSFPEHTDINVLLRHYVRDNVITSQSVRCSHISIVTHFEVTMLQREQIGHDCLSMVKHGRYLCPSYFGRGGNI